MDEPTRKIVPHEPVTMTGWLQLNRPQLVERKLLNLLLPLFIMASLAAWLSSEAQGLARWYERYALTTAAVCFAGLLLWNLVSLPHHVWRIRTLALIVAPGVVILRWGSVLWDLRFDGYDDNFYFDLSPWLILCTALYIFLIPSRWSWIAAFSYYGLILAMLAAFMLSGPPPLPSFVGDEFLLNIVIAPAVFITLLTAFTRLRAEYVRSRTHAEDLAAQALLDVLTGLHNRRAFSQSFRRAQARQVRNRTPLTAVLLDIDHFKRVNDTYGHQVGDEVLVKLANVLTRELRGSDEVFRWGGEEFMLLLENTPLEGAIEVAERIRKAVENEPMLDKSVITISLGVTEVLPNEPEEVIYPRADIALYASKRDGRNRVSVEPVPTQVQNSQ